MTEPLPEAYLARHGETAWSLSGQHTGRSDLPLTRRGVDNARKFRRRLQGIDFNEVLVRPLRSHHDRDTLEQAENRKLTT